MIKEQAGIADNKNKVMKKTFLALIIFILFSCTHKVKPEKDFSFTPVRSGAYFQKSDTIPKQTSFRFEKPGGTYLDIAYSDSFRITMDTSMKVTMINRANWYFIHNGKPMVMVLPNGDMYFNPSEFCGGKDTLTFLKNIYK